MALVVPIVWTLGEGFAICWESIAIASAAATAVGDAECNN